MQLKIKEKEKLSLNIRKTEKTPIWKILAIILIVIFFNFIYAGMVVFVNYRFYDKPIYAIMIVAVFTIITVLSNIFVAIASSKKSLISFFPTLAIIGYAIYTFIFK